MSERITICPRCKARGKTWAGGDPECGFIGGIFTGENWNCATLNALRELVMEEHDGRCWGDDYSAAVLYGGDGFVLLRWYKNRGQTEDARWLEYGDTDPTPLTLAQAEETLRIQERFAPPADGGRS